MRRRRLMLAAKNINYTPWLGSLGRCSRGNQLRHYGNRFNGRVV